MAGPSEESKTVELKLVLTSTGELKLTEANAQLKIMIEYSEKSQLGFSRMNLQLQQLNQTMGNFASKSGLQMQKLLEMMATQASRSSIQMQRLTETVTPRMERMNEVARQGSTFWATFWGAFSGVNALSAAKNIFLFFDRISTMAAGGIVSFRRFFEAIKNVYGAIETALDMSQIIHATEKYDLFSIALERVVKTQKAVRQIQAAAFEAGAKGPFGVADIEKATQTLLKVPAIRAQLFAPEEEVEANLKRIYDLTIRLASIEPERGIPGAVLALRTSLQGQFRQLTRQYGISVKELELVSGKTAKQLKANSQELFKALEEVTKKLVSDDTLKRLGDQVSRRISNINEVFENIIPRTIGGKGFASTVKKLFAFLDEQLLAFARPGGSFEKNFAQGFSDAFSRIVVNISRIISSLLGVTFKGAKNPFDALADVLLKFAQSVVKTTGLIADFFSSKGGEGFLDVIGKAIRGTFDVLKTVVTAIVVTIINLFDSLKKAFADFELVVAEYRDLTSIGTDYVGELHERRRYERAGREDVEAAAAGGITGGPGAFLHRALESDIKQKEFERKISGEQRGSELSFDIRTPFEKAKEDFAFGDRRQREQLVAQLSPRERRGFDALAAKTAVEQFGGIAKVAQDTDKFTESLTKLRISWGLGPLHPTQLKAMKDQITALSIGESTKKLLELKLIPPDKLTPELKAELDKLNKQLDDEITNRFKGEPIDETAARQERFRAGLQTLTQEFDTLGEAAHEALEKGLLTPAEEAVKEFKKIDDTAKLVLETVKKFTGAELPAGIKSVGDIGPLLKLLETLNAPTVIPGISGGVFTNTINDLRAFLSAYDSAIDRIADNANNLKIQRAGEQLKTLFTIDPADMIQFQRQMELVAEEYRNLVTVVTDAGERLISRQQAGQLVPQAFTRGRTEAQRTFEGFTAFGGGDKQRLLQNKAIEESLRSQVGTMGVLLQRLLASVGAETERQFVNELIAQELGKQTEELNKQNRVIGFQIQRRREEEELQRKIEAVTTGGVAGEEERRAIVRQRIADYGELLKQLDEEKTKRQVVADLFGRIVKIVTTPQLIKATQDANIELSETIGHIDVITELVKQLTHQTDQQTRSITEQNKQIEINNRLRSTGGQIAQALGLVTQNARTGEQEILGFGRIAQEEGTKVAVTFVQSFQSGLSDGLVKVFKGEFDSIHELWTSLLDSMLKAFADMLAQLAIRGLFSQLLGGVGGGLFSGLGGAPGPGQLGFVAGAEGQGIAAGSILHRQHGGGVHGGQTYTVGEHGPELLHMGAGSSGNVFSNAQGMPESVMSQAINLTIVNMVDSGSMVQKGLASQAGRNTVANTIAGDVRNGGVVRKSMHRYNR